MSAEIEITNGQASMFSVRETPWHGLGHIIPQAPTMEDAIRLAGLDWQVRLQPLHMRYDGEEMNVPAWATVRDTDRSVLGVVGPTYRPVQNRDAFKWFQPWLESGKVTLETAGSLREGRHIWILARVLNGGSELEVQPGDTVRQYILLSNGHDGTMALRNGFTGIRVVCANTLAGAHHDGASKLLKIRHTKRAGEAMDQIREIMDIARSEFVANIDQYRALARAGVTKDSLREYIKRVFQPKLVAATAKPELTVDEADVERADLGCDRLMGRILPLFEGGRGNQGKTWWDAYNAVTEYLSYERGRSADIRLDSLWFGDGARVNQRALDTARQLAFG